MSSCVGRVMVVLSTGVRGRRQTRTDKPGAGAVHAALIGTSPLGTGRACPELPRTIAPASGESRQQERAGMDW